MSTIRVDNFGPSSGGTTYSARGIAKAWVNFDGSGTIAARDSENLSSLTDNGTGDYTVNFSSNFNAADYVLSSAARWNSPGSEGRIVSYNNATTVTGSAMRLVSGTPGTAGSTALTKNDEVFVFCNFHGDLA